MSMFPDMSMKSCYVPCPKYMVDAGQCSCHNRNSQDDMWSEYWSEYHKDLQRRARENVINTIIEENHKNDNNTIQK